MTLQSPIRAVWKSAELLIAFHKNKRREKRDAPFLWRPKEAFARLLAKPEDQEAFVVLKGTEDVADVQIKLHPDKVVIRRDQPLGWSGIIVSEDSVSVSVDNDWIRIKHDGSVVVKRDMETTFFEGDGSIIKIDPDTEITVSSDSSSVTRRTVDRIEALTPDGVVSRNRKIAQKG